MDDPLTCTGNTGVGKLKEIIFLIFSYCQPARFGFFNMKNGKRIKFVVVVAGGDCVGLQAKKILHAADWVIAADGGANSCVRLGRVPNVVVGDFDSITKKNLVNFKKNKFTKVIYDPDQNKTDLELAIKILNKLKPKQATILGVLGDRFDHTLANIITLDKINKKINLKIVAKDHEIHLPAKKIIIKGKIGEIISVIPLTKVKGLTYSGLKWPLKKAKVDFGWIGIRNQLVGAQAQISLISGKILIIKTHK